MGARVWTMYNRLKHKTWPQTIKSGQLMIADDNYRYSHFFSGKMVVMFICFLVRCEMELYRVGFAHDNNSRFMELLSRGFIGKDQKLVVN